MPPESHSSRPILRKPSEHLLSVIKALGTTEQKIFWVLFTMFAVVSALILVRISDHFMVEVPTHGGILTEGVIGFPRHINPVLARTDTDRDLSQLIYSGLLRQGEDGILIPDLAESISVSEDGKTYTASLRENLKWHDGEPVTAHDVVFTISAIQDGSREIKSSKRASWAGVSVSAENDQTVVFILPAPYQPFKEQLTVGILPAHLWSSLPQEQFDLSNLNLRPVGTGPYRIDDVITREDGIPVEYTLKANPHFVLGKPYIDLMRIRFYGNQEEVLKAYDQGDIQAFGEVDPSLAKTLLQDTHSRVLSAVLKRVFALYFNQSQAGIFQDKAVRIALDTVIDREQIVRDVLYGYGSPIQGPTPPGPFGMVFVSTTTPEERFREADEILTQAGWKKNENGIYEKTDTKKKTTQTLTFAITTGDTEELKKAAQAAGAQWRNFGAEVEIKVYDQSTLAKEVIVPRHFDVLLYGAVVDRLPDLLPFWHSSQRADPGLNIAMYANSKADTYLEESRQGTSTEQVFTTLTKALEEIRSDRPAAFLYTPSFLYAMGEDVGGISLGSLTTPSERFTSIHRWYLKTENVWPMFTNNRPMIIREN